jgi:hypothetical protein
VFRRRRNVSRWILHQNTITAHLELQGDLGFDRSASGVERTSRVLSQRISILFGSCLTKSLDDPLANQNNHHPLQTRTAAIPKQLQGHRVFRCRRNVSRWELYQTTITAHLELQGHRVFRRRRNVSRWILYQTTISAHLELQGHRVFRRRRNVSRWIPYHTAITAHLELQGHRVFRRRRNVSRWNHIKPPSQRISILFVSCLTKSLDDPLQTRTATTQKNSCKDIECSAAGGMYRDGNLIKPPSQRISSCKDIECSAAGGMYRDGNHIQAISQRISILFVSCLTKSLDDLLQTRTTTTRCKRG